MKAHVLLGLALLISAPSIAERLKSERGITSRPTTFKVARNSRPTAANPVRLAQSTSSPISILDTSNNAGVSDNPTSPAIFSRCRSFKVTNLWTYHWNNGSGANGGNISLRDSAGRIYGPWKVSTSGGSGGKNVNWMCSPNATLPAGTYTVIDSDNATWSQNPGSAGRGFVRVTAISQ